MNKILIYFGAIGNPGHYYWLSESASSSHQSIWDEVGFPVPSASQVDGVFVPTKSIKQGSARDVTPVTHLGFRIIAWHDYTCDRRPGSNSAILAMGFSNREEILTFANVQFPTVMARQTAPLNFLEGR